MLLACALLLSGCRGVTQLGSTIGYQLFNDVDASEALCMGGLKGRVESGDVLLYESPLVPHGAYESENVLRPPGVDQGSPVQVEAWCYGPEGEEVGYVRHEGTLVPSVSVGVVFSGLAAPPGRSCLEGVEVRGTPPCVSSSIIQQSG